MSEFIGVCAFVLAAALPAAASDDGPEQAPNTWVKRSPGPGAPVSPRMGYESSWGYDPRAHALIRWGGHNQGGGEQNAETWTLDPRTWRWTLKEPNDAPPGVCCAQTTYEDRGLRRGIIAHYTVQAEDADGHRGPASARARTQPRVVEDIAAAVRSASEVELTWTPPPEGRDVVGYHVERAPVEVLSEDQLIPQTRRTPPLPQPSAGALRRIAASVGLTDGPVRGPRYADAIDLSRPRPIAGPPAWERRIPPEQLDERGRPYRWAVFAYRVRAVNALGVEGGPSPYALTLPAAPQHLFARERGGACDLRWAESRAPGLT